MKNYVIVLGSNLCSKFGNSEETLKKCVDEIRLSLPIKAISESKWYISSSFINKSEPVYVNVGLNFNSNLEPLLQPKYKYIICVYIYIYIYIYVENKYKLCIHIYIYIYICVCV